MYFNELRAKYVRLYKCKFYLNLDRDAAHIPGVQSANCRLKAANVTVSYQTNGTGFVGEPSGLPMNVTVSLTGLTHEFYFIGPLMKIFGGTFANVANIPTFATTLPSEDMTTN